MSHASPSCAYGNVFTDYLSGGYFGPAVAAALLEDKKAASKHTKPEHHFIGVDTIGIMNGLIDLSIQVPQLVKYPNNNSYDLEIYNASMLEELNAEAEKCSVQSTECDRVLEEMDYDALKGEPMPGICFAGAVCWNSISDTFDTVAKVGSHLYYNYVCTLR